jgi:hypothetical protein
LMIKSERGWSKCSYPFKPSHSGSRRTESTRDHCSLCFPEEVFMIPVYHIPCSRLGPGQPESCNKPLEKYSPACRVFKIGSHLNILNIVFPKDFPLVQQFYICSPYCSSGGPVLMGEKRWNE